MRTTTSVESETQSKLHRFTTRIPIADISCIDWWNAQDDPSQSIRQLIRNDIRENGVTDTANRPVQIAAHASSARTAHSQESVVPVVVSPKTEPLQLNTAGARLVQEFWDEFEDDFTWDLLPFTFLRDLYQAWISRVHPDMTPMGRNLFISTLRQHVAHSRTWSSPANQTSSTHIGDRMSANEPLIRDYRLARWSAHGPNCKAVNQCCTRTNQRGLIRTQQDAQAAHRSHESVDERITRLEAELAALSRLHVRS